MIATNRQTAATIRVNKRIIARTNATKTKTVLLRRAAAAMIVKMRIL
jgi:hypothetical protein